MRFVNDTIEETIDYMVKPGLRVGVVQVRTYIPSCVQALIVPFTATVKVIY